MTRQPTAMFARIILKDKDNPEWERHLFPKLKKGESIAWAKLTDCENFKADQEHLYSDLGLYFEIELADL